VVVEQVVHDAVTEISGPYLAWLRVGDYEADRGAWLVSAGIQLGVQLHKVALHIELKGQCTPAAALVAAAVEVGLH